MSDSSAFRGSHIPQAHSGSGWWSQFRADFARYRQHRPDASNLVLLLTEQGLWALLQYRTASGLHRSTLPNLAKRPLLLGVCILQKLVEILTGISIPYRTRIGAGLYIGHFGNVILHEEVVLGCNCNLSQGVTIGMSGRGDRKGVPVIGDRVYIAANGVVVGRIVIGDDAAIAANSLVTRDVEPHTTMMGVPARPVSRIGSAGYIQT